MARCSTVLIRMSLFLFSLASLFLACGKPPSSPTELSCSPVDGTTVELTWESPTDNISGFKIGKECDSGRFDTVETIASNPLTYKVTGLKPATRYRFVVWAYNGKGISPASNVVPCTTASYRTTVYNSTILASNKPSGDSGLRKESGSVSVRRSSSDQSSKQKGNGGAADSSKSTSNQATDGGSLGVSTTLFAGANVFIPIEGIWSFDFNGWTGQLSIYADGNSRFKGVVHFTDKRNPPYPDRLIDSGHVTGKSISFVISPPDDTCEGGRFEGTLDGTGSSMKGNWIWYCDGLPYVWSARRTNTLDHANVNVAGWWNISFNGVKGSIDITIDGNGNMNGTFHYLNVPDSNGRLDQLTCQNNIIRFETVHSQQGPGGDFIGVVTNNNYMSGTWIWRGDGKTYAWWAHR